MPVKQPPPNILEDLLGVKADRAAPATATQELEALTRITHRGRHRTAKAPEAPDQMAQPAEPLPVPEVPPDREPRAAPSARPEPPAAAHTPPGAKAITLPALFTALRMDTKNFQFEIRMPDREPRTYAFRNGHLTDDYWLSQPDGPAAGECLVLVVDADQDFVQATARGLAEYESRFLVLTASTGRQAVHLLETRKIDLLLTGLKLPEMDGFELLAHMRAHFPTIPALAISTFNFPAMHARVKQLGARRHLIKPIAAAELANLFLDILGRGGGRGQSIKGASFTDFVTRLGLHTASCFVDISLPGQDRFLGRVENGIILGASRGSATGGAAVRELADWDHFRIAFRPAPF